MIQTNINGKLEVNNIGQLYDYTAPTPPGPDYVTDGLKLYLDAAKTDSYPGTGNIWYDISGNDYDSAAFNDTEITWSSDNSGILNFSDGVSQLGIQISPPGSVLDFQTTSCTVMGASRYQAGGTHMRVIGSNAPTNWLVGHWGGSTESCYCGGWAAQGGPDDSNWRLYTYTFNTTSCNFYVNNTFKGNGGTSGPNGLFLGASETPCHCSVGFVMMYNRVLTSDEMTLNFNYFKNRYGIS